MTTFIKFFALTFSVCTVAQAAEPGATPARAAFPPVPTGEAVARFEPDPDSPSKIRMPEAPIRWEQRPSEIAPLAPQPAPQVDPASQRRPQPTAAPGPAVRDRADDDADADSQDWVLAVEGFTRAPIDVGVQAGLQVPLGLRLSGGYGKMPGPYLGFLTSVAALASGNDSGGDAVLTKGIQTGRTWRVQAGIRPFSGSGLYLDVGYTHARLGGALTASAFGLSSLPEGATLSVDTKLSMWLVEIGFQTDIANTVSFGLGFGVTGTMKSKTRLALSHPSPEASALADQQAEDLDQQLERYGVLPTVTLRLGFDLL